MMNSPLNERVPSVTVISGRRSRIAWNAATTYANRPILFFNGQLTSWHARASQPNPAICVKSRVTALFEP